MAKYTKLSIKLALQNIEKDTVQNRKWRILLRVEDVPRSQ